MNPKGRVLSVDTSEPSRLVLVEVDALVACQRCLDGNGCGAGLLGASAKERHVMATVADGVDVVDGDLVSLVLEPQNVLRAALIVYGYPLAGALLAALLALLANLGELAAAMFAIAGIGVGLLGARARLKNADCLKNFTPRVVENLGIEAS